jgi:hypothetical protein
MSKYELDEFFCLKCSSKREVKKLENMCIVQYKVGLKKDKAQTALKGVCPKCKSNLIKFISQPDVNALEDMGVKNCTVSKTPKGCVHPRENVKGKCLKKCEKGFQRSPKLRCAKIRKCGTGKESVNNKCLVKCSVGKERNRYNNRCMNPRKRGFKPKPILNSSLSPKFFKSKKLKEIVKSKKQEDTNIDELERKRQLKRQKTLRLRQYKRYVKSKSKKPMESKSKKPENVVTMVEKLSENVRQLSDVANDLSSSLGSNRDVRFNSKIEYKTIPRRKINSSRTELRGSSATRSRGSSATRSRGSSATRSRGSSATRSRGSSATRSRGSSATRSRRGNTNTTVNAVKNMKRKRSTRTKNEAKAQRELY